MKLLGWIIDRILHGDPACIVTAPAEGSRWVERNSDFDWGPVVVEKVGRKSLFYTTAKPTGWPDDIPFVPNPSSCASHREFLRWYKPEIPNHVEPKVPWPRR